MGGRRSPELGWLARPARACGSMIARSAAGASSPMIGCMGSISCSVFPPVQPTSDSPAVNHPGKPDAGNQPVRFDAGAGTRRRSAGSLVPAHSTQTAREQRAGCDLNSMPLLRLASSVVQKGSLHALGRKMKTFLTGSWQRVRSNIPDYLPGDEWLHFAPDGDHVWEIGQPRGKGKSSINRVTVKGEKNGYTLARP